MKKILFYYPHINSIGGVEMAMLRLAERLKASYEIYFGFRQADSDIDLLLRFAENGKVINLNHVHQNFDICVYCSLYCVKNIKADKHIRWVHGCVTDMGYKMKPEPDIKNIVAVGKVCAEQIHQQTGNDPTVILNELNPNIIKLSAKKEVVEKRKLTLCTVSRISPEKGFGRMLKLSEQLKAARIDFIWHIVGSGYNKHYEAQIKASAPKEWVFHGNKDNPFPFMKQADFLVQLSDYEAFGYVLLESLVIGTPVITTNYSSASEMINHEKNGYIIDKDFDAVDLKILEKIPKFKYYHKPQYEKWFEILEN